MAPEQCDKCGTITGYRDPEETGNYWIGVWDFVYDIVTETPNPEWVYSHPFFKICMVKVPDLMVDALRWEFGREDLALIAEENMKMTDRLATD